jgi:hypothetical protein
MTFVGKILVFVIMGFALLMLGISTVVFTTATDWKKATDTQKAMVADLQKKGRDLKSEVDRYKGEFDAAKKTHAAEAKKLEDTIAAKDAEIKRMQADTTEVRTELATASQSAKTALDEAAERRAETDRLREQKLAVEQQANEYKLRQAELNDKIRELTRMLETATTNAKDLRERVARFASKLRELGVSDDVSTMKGLESPPAVQGEVLRVDRQSKTIEISIGSDDGLVAGHLLYIYRTKPRPDYIGQVKIISTDPDQSVARVQGNTINGKKIEEGDIVSTTLRPRS